MTIIGAIPVKKESKRFTGKNFMKLGGEHLINLAIRRLSHHVDHIIISTDAVEEVEAIIKAGKEGFADNFIEVIQRSDGAIGGDLPSNEPICDALCRGHWHNNDIVVITQVTSPLVRSQTVARCLAIWSNLSGLDLLVTVNPDCQPNGGVYICKVGHFEEIGPFYRGNVHVYHISFNEGLDIDYPHQLPIAEAIARGDES
jgi:CMP-N-acetylneuraminic acid synthetase